jgi:hypothetical protein
MRPLIFLLAAFVAARAFCMERLDGNGELEKLETSLYAASVFRNGAFTFTPSGGPKLSVSFIQRWSRCQNSEHAKLMKFEKKTEDGDTVFYFSYFWSGGEVTERLAFFKDGFDAAYTYEPFVSKKIDCFTVWAASADMSAPDCFFTAVKYDKNPGDLEIFAPPLPESARLAELSMIKNNGLVLSFVPCWGAWLWAFSKGLGVTNNGRFWEKTVYEPGQTYRSGLKCFILRAASQ